MATNMNMLKAKMVEKGFTKEEVARAIGVDISTFYRKMKSDGLKFSIGEMHELSKVLSLTKEESCSIFLS